MDAAPRGPCRSPRYSPFPTPEHGASISLPQHPAGLAKNPASFQASLPQHSAPWRTNCTDFRLPLPVPPPRGEGAGPGSGPEPGRPCGRRAAALGRRRSGSVRTPTAPSLVRSAAPSGAAPLSAGPGRRGEEGGGRAGGRRGVELRRSRCSRSAPPELPGWILWEYR